MRRAARRLRAALPPLLLALATGCGGERSAGDEGEVAGASATPVAPRAASGGGPFVRVLGTAQDGGFPHAACSCSRCRAARLDAEQARLVASLAIVVPATDEVFLIDATPDVRPQLDRLEDVRRPPADRVDRAPLAGIFLTHAHIGHYVGLAFFGFEAIHAQRLPVHATPSMTAFLRGNAPWEQLVTLENIALVDLAAAPVELGGGVSVEAFPVPHRDEYTDTVGFRLRGPRRIVVYVPDSDPWAAWERPLTALLEGVDVALLDGTFYSADELPGRAIAEIRHPLVTDTIELLQPLVARGLEVYFTHLNHSNPLLDAPSAERTALEAAGFAVLAEGQEIGL